MFGRLPDQGDGCCFFELSLKVRANLHVRVTYDAAPGIYDPVALIAGLAP